MPYNLSSCSKTFCKNFFYQVNIIIKSFYRIKRSLYNFYNLLYAIQNCKKNISELFIKKLVELSLNIK